MREEYNLSRLKVHKNPYVNKLKEQDMSVLAMKAMRSAIKKLIAEKILRDEPMIIWKNGKVVKVSAKDLRKF